MSHKEITVKAEELARKYHGEKFNQFSEKQKKEEIGYFFQSARTRLEMANW